MRWVMRIFILMLMVCFPVICDAWCYTLLKDKTTISENDYPPFDISYSKDGASYEYLESQKRGEHLLITSNDCPEPPRKIEVISNFFEIYKSTASIVPAKTKNPHLEEIKRLFKEKTNCTLSADECFPYPGKSLNNQTFLEDSNIPDVFDKSPFDKNPFNESPLSDENLDRQPSSLCAENGSCYGDISELTNKPKTIAVRGYHRKDGTYVRGHFRSR